MARNGEKLLLERLANHEGAPEKRMLSKGGFLFQRDRFFGVLVEGDKT